MFLPGDHGCHQLLDLCSCPANVVPDDIRVIFVIVGRCSRATSHSPRNFAHLLNPHRLTGCKHYTDYSMARIADLGTSAGPPRGVGVRLIPVSLTSSRATTCSSGFVVTLGVASAGRSHARALLAQFHPGALVVVSQPTPGCCAPPTPARYTPASAHADDHQGR